MPEVVMYSTAWCPYCRAAKSLLQGKGVDFEEIDLDREPARRGEMEERSGRFTVPQVFIDGTPHGGFDDLNALDRKGELDALLGLTEN
ncbi:MAG: glutaredoxin 3 [Acidobacteriota bacterium]